MEIKIIYEDPNLLIINKPDGVVVYAGVGNEKNTLVDWLIEKYPEMSKLSWPDPSRPGIVHRLDKDTSGLMILAKNPEVLAKLQRLMQERKISAKGRSASGGKKTYLALVYGKLDKKAGEIESFLGRDPHHRRKQSSQTIYFDFQPGKKRKAKTEYRVLKEYQYHDAVLSLIEATLDTGRTHQIRVHLKSIGHPVIGDQTYNTKHSRIISRVLNLNRQFLHSYKLEFNHPLTGKQLDFIVDMPEDLKIVLGKLTPGA